MPRYNKKFYSGNFQNEMCVRVANERINEIYYYFTLLDIAVIIFHNILSHKKIILKFEEKLIKNCGMKSFWGEIL